MGKESVEDVFQGRMANKGDRFAHPVISHLGTQTTPGKVFQSPKEESHSGEVGFFDLSARREVEMDSGAAEGGCRFVNIYSLHLDKVPMAR